MTKQEALALVEKFENTDSSVLSLENWFQCDSIIVSHLPMELKIRSLKIIDKIIGNDLEVTENDVHEHILGIVENHSQS